MLKNNFSKQLLFKFLQIVILIGIFTCIVSAENKTSYSIQDFLGQTVFHEVAVSPDGRHVAFTTAKDNFEKNIEDVTLWRMDLDSAGNKTDLVKLTQDIINPSSLKWSPDSRYISFIATRSSEAAPQIYVFDQRGGEPLAITDTTKFKNGISGYDWMPDSIAIIFATQDSLSSEKEKSLKSFYGDVKRYSNEVPNTAFYKAKINNLGNENVDSLIRVTGTVNELSISPNGKRVAYVSGANSSLGFTDGSEFEVFVFDIGNISTQQITRNFVWENNIKWDKQGEKIYCGCIGTPDTKYMNYLTYLGSISMTDKKLEMCIPDSIDGLLNSKFLSEQTFLVNAIVSTSSNFYLLNSQTKQTEALTKFRGRINEFSCSAKCKLIVFTFVGNNSFEELYISQGIEKLNSPVRVTNFNDELNKIPTPQIETVKWSNGEGDTIEGILYWPPGKYHTKGLPLVVDIHGGPWSASTEVMSSTSVQALYYPALLASRGYLVLRPNYRGGIGRGNAFLKAINGYSVSRPTTDILTGVNYLVSSGWADNNLMGVMGHSYGGLLTNALITHTNCFRAACSTAGVWNDISYFGIANNFIQTDVRYLWKTPWENFKNYWEESAISGAAKIKTPTLIVFGNADKIVPTSQGQELYKAMVRLGVPTELLVFPGEGHVFSKPLHKLTKVKAELAWFDHYILGKPLPKFE